MTRRVALVTGCSSGIGLELAVVLAQAGWTTYATMRNLDKRGALDKAAAEAGVDLRALELDVADEQSVDGAVAAVLAATGRIDLLVTTRGQSIHGPTEEFSDAEALALFEVNFFGAHRTMRAVLRQCERSARAPSSQSRRSSPLVTPPYFNMYAASKHALDALNRVGVLRGQALRQYASTLSNPEPWRPRSRPTRRTSKRLGQPRRLAQSSNRSRRPFWMGSTTEVCRRGVAADAVLGICETPDSPFRTITAMGRS